MTAPYRIIDNPSPAGLLGSRYVLILLAYLIDLALPLATVLVLLRVPGWPVFWFMGYCLLLTLDPFFARRALPQFIRRRLARSVAPSASGGSETPALLEALLALGPNGHTACHPALALSIPVLAILVIWPPESALVLAHNTVVAGLGLSLIARNLAAFFAYTFGSWFPILDATLFMPEGKADSAAQTRARPALEKLLPWAALGFVWSSCLLRGTLSVIGAGMSAVSMLCWSIAAILKAQRTLRSCTSSTVAFSHRRTVIAAESYRLFPWRLRVHAGLLLAWSLVGLATGVYRQTVPLPRAAAAHVTAAWQLVPSIVGIVLAVGMYVIHRSARQRTGFPSVRIRLCGTRELKPAVVIWRTSTDAPPQRVDPTDAWWS